MKKFNLLIILFVMTISATFAGEQNIKSPAENIYKFINTTMKFNRIFPQEKVYLHFDNTGYYIGEKIWFKAYVLSSDSNRYTHLSKVLYVELVSPSGDVVEQCKLEIKNGQAWGIIELKKVLISGFYEVRAYTRYMTNWGKESIFSRVFPIFRRTETEGDYSKKVIDEITYQKRLPDYREKDSVKVQKMNVHFYPEGGKMIEGKLDKVAFDVTDKNGEHLETTGMLICGEDTLKDISTIREGRGFFSFIPSDKMAKLILQDQKGKMREFTLPTADKEGCALRLNTLSTNDIIAELDATKALQGQLVGMVFTHNGTVMDCDTVTLAERTVTHFFKKSKLADGVNQLTIIDTKGQILADRMVFIYPRKDIGTINISSPTKNLYPCKKVELDAESRPNTTFSISVKDADTQTNGYNQNAATWLLLSSDLRGFIENPKYYLEDNDEKHCKDADLLMMVQGWRRYNFEMMEGKNKFAWQQPVENCLYIDGKLHQVKKKNSVDNVDLTLTLYNRLGDIVNGSTTTEKKGNYAFKVPTCYGEWNMLMKTTKEDKDLKYYVAVNRNFSPEMRHLSYYESQELPIDTPKLEFNNTFKDNVQWPMDKNNYLLKEVKVKGHRIFNQTKAAWTSEITGAYHAGIYYDCDKAADEFGDRGEDTPSIMEWLKIKNPFFDGGTSQEGVGHYTKFSCNFYDDGLMYKRRPIVWIVNNQFLFVTNAPHKICGTIDKDDYEDAREPFPVYLEEVKSVYISEDNKAYERFLRFDELSGCHPVTVFVYTHPDLPKRERGLRRTHFFGYNVPTEFENTVNNYSIMAPQPDYRRTLYWNPNVTTDKDGKAKMEFYNNSTCKQIIISAEGVTADGKAIVYK